MNELQEKNKNATEEVRPLKTSIARINSGLQLIGEGAVIVGNELEYVKNNKTYKEEGFNNIHEFGEHYWGYKRTHITRLLRIGREYDCPLMGSELKKLPIGDLDILAKLDNKEEREKIAKKRNEVNQKEFKKLVNEKKEMLEEKRKAEQAKIKTEKELERLKEELKKEKKKEPKLTEKDLKELKKELEDEVVKGRVKEQLKKVEQRKSELEERVGKLDKYQSEVNDYQKQKRDTEKEIDQLQDYKDELEKKNKVIKRRAEIVQGIRNATEKLKKKKGEVEELLQRDVNLDNPDIRNIEIEAEFLEDFAELLFEYTSYQRGDKNKMEGDVIEINK